MESESYSFSTRLFVDGGWRSLLGGSMVHLALGTVYCWASNTAYVTSAMRDQHHYITYSITFPTYVCILLCQGLFVPCGGLLEQRFGAQKTVLMGGSVVVGATFLAVPAIAARSLVLLYLTAGALYGTGCGLVYTVPIVCSYRWLPRHKGFVSGVIVAGYGAGALVFDQVSTAYANPQNVPLQSGDDDTVDDDLWTDYINCDATRGNGVCSRASSLYLLLGCCFALLIFCGACLIGEPDFDRDGGCVERAEAAAAAVVESGGQGRGEDDHDEEEERGGDLTADLLALPAKQAPPPPPPPSTSLPPLSATKASLPLSFGGGGSDYGPRKDSSSRSSSDGVRTIRSAEGTDNQQHPQTILELVNSLTARVTTMTYILTATPGVFIAGSYKVIGSQYFSNDRFLTDVGSVASIGNCLGRLFWGWASDRFGWNACLVTLSSCQSALLALYRPAASARSQGLFAAWTACLYFNYGGNFAIYPVAVADLFGRPRCGINYGVVFGVYGLVSAAILLALTFGIDSGSSWLTYSLSLIQACGVFSGLALKGLRSTSSASSSAAFSSLPRASPSPSAKQQQQQAAYSAAASSPLHG